MNIHIFDGQLLEAKALLSVYLESAAEVSSEDKIMAFEQLKTFIQPNLNFDIIVNDFKTFGHNLGSNYDPTNELYADDLLYLCAILLEKLDNTDEFLFIFNQQLIDMSTGMCPQGRTHRLFQIIMAFKEFL